MANQTVSVNRNLDEAAIAGLLNGEDITIDSGAILTINSDNRYSQQAAVIGNITISSASGGQCIVDATETWWMPYDAGTGNVPVLGTVNTDDVTGSTAGTGEFLGVYTELGATPSASGGAMPATGFIKFRRVTAAFVDNEVMTFTGGATATVNSATGGQRGWLHLVGEDATAITVPRLGKFETMGDWFYLADTDGTDDQRINVPVLDHIPAIQIETSAGSNTYEWWLNAARRWGTATQFVPTDVRGKYFGQWREYTGLTTVSGTAVITGFTDTSELRVGMPVIFSAGFAAANLSRATIVSIVLNTSVTVQVNANASVAGTVTMSTIDYRLTLARRASNSCGFKPATGLKIRVPNIFISNAVSTGFSGQILSQTITDRWEFVTTSAGEINVNNVSSNMYMNMSAPYSVNIKDSGIITTIVSNTASDTIIDNVAIACEHTRAATALSAANLFSGIEMTDVRAVRYSGVTSGDAVLIMSDVDGGAGVTDCMSEVFGSTTAITRGNAAINTALLTRVSNIDLTNYAGLGGRISAIQCQNINVPNYMYADQINGTTVNTNPVSAALDLNSSCINVKLNGFSNFGGIANVHPYNAIIASTGGNLQIKARNIGTSAAPYNCGSANQTGVLFTGAVTKGLELKRCYLDNTRTFLATLANTIQDVVIDNCWGDGADNQAINSVNTLVRGNRFTNVVAGQVSVYGHHWQDFFTTTTAGRVVIAMNEPLAATADQVTVTSGAPKFTSAGTINMPTAGDEVIWETPSFVIGHTAFGTTAPTVTGTVATNINLFYAIDTGAGYSAFKNLVYYRAGGSGVNASTNVSMTSTTGVAVNDRIFGTNIGVGAKVQSITDGTTIVSTVANIGTVSGVLTFSAIGDESIPAFTDLYNQGGFKLKVKATTSTTGVTNALTYIRIDTVTTSTEQQRQYPFYEPEIGYTGTLSSSVLGVFVDSSGQTAKTGSHVTDKTTAVTPWDSDVSVVTRLRKPGYAAIENTTTLDEDGSTIAVEQEDYTTIADTDPGALGITVTNHGASPVSWESKNWSITIQTTNDALTAAQVANYINYNTSLLATFNSFIGPAWPEMIIPDGANFQTARGRLMTSAGATLKGVRVVRNDGTTAVPGFTQMQADDGTYYVAPTVANFIVNGLTVNSRLYIENVSTNTILYNAIHGSASHTITYTDGTDFTNGDLYEVRVTFVNGATAKLPIKYTGSVSSSGATIGVSQEDWQQYIDAGISGAAVTECDTDYVNIEVDIDDPDNTTDKSRIAAFIVYAMHNEAQGIEDWFDVIEYRSAGSAIIKSSVATIKIDNVKTGVALDVIDPFQLRMDDDSSMIDTSTNTIRWDNSAEVIIVETGTSGLTAGEAATLALIDVAVSTRLADADYIVPANSDIAAIKAKTDNLPANTATELTAIKTNTNLIPATV